MEFSEYLIGLGIEVVAFTDKFRKHFDPKEWIDWLYLVWLVVGLLWIGYQFRRLRGLSEKGVEAWIIARLDQKRERLEQEREAYLRAFGEERRSSAWKQTLVGIAARLKLAVFFIIRLLLLRRRRPSIVHAVTLFRAGDRSGARRELESIAGDLADKIVVYEKQVDAKRLEACNAFLYAGRVAEHQRDERDSRRAFDKVLSLSKEKDVDAHRLIARQYIAAGNTGDALRHYDLILAHAQQVGDDRVRADTYRLQAEALGIRTNRGRELLRQSLELESAHKNYRGLARTQELLGDIYAPRPQNQKRATGLYSESKQNYALAGDTEDEKRLQKKLEGLLGQETWLSQWMANMGQFMLRTSMRLRIQPQTT